MFPFFKVLFIATKRVCLQNIELKYQKLSLFWKARNHFSALPYRGGPRKLRGGPRKLREGYIEPAILKSCTFPHIKKEKDSVIIEFPGRKKQDFKAFSWGSLRMLVVIICVSKNVKRKKKKKEKNVSLMGSVAYLPQLHVDSKFGGTFALMLPAQC